MYFYKKKIFFLNWCNVISYTYIDILNECFKNRYSHELKCKVFTIVNGIERLTNSVTWILLIPVYDGN